MARRRDKPGQTHLDLPGLNDHPLYSPDVADEIGRLIMDVATLSGKLHTLQQRVEKLERVAGVHKKSSP